MEFMYLLTAFLWFLAKYICLGAIALGGIMLGSAYRKNKNLKERAQDEEVIFIQQKVAGLL